MTSGRKLAEGSVDRMPGDVQRLRALETRLREVFAQAGYEEVEPPLLELWEQLDTGAIGADACYQTTDRMGRTLVLRPEFTTQIARMALGSMSARMETEALRLCALGTVFEPGEGTRPPRPITQADVEFFGDGGAQDDQASAELIALAVQSMRACGLPSFSIEIGHAGFLRALLSEAGLTPTQSAEVIACAERRDSLGLELTLRTMPLNEDTRARIAALPGWFGGEDILDEAEAWCGGPESRAALSQLRGVVRALGGMGLGDIIVADLGMAHAMDYYTGVIFRGLTRHLGAPLLSGGRYDGLMELLSSHASSPSQDERPKGGAGFAIDVTALDEALRSGTEAAQEDGGLLTFALAKGRLGDKALALLRASGFDVPDIDESSRKLVHTNARGDRFLLVKPGDVPAYVDGGVADIGVVGKDTLMEENRPLCEVLDLGYGVCRLCIAGYPDQNHAGRHLRVATKYPGVARQYYEQKSQPIEIVKLSGSIELAPVMGLSDVILDIVESGGTLRANGLDVLEEIGRCSARLVVNRVSMKTKAQRVRDLLRSLRGAL